MAEKEEIPEPAEKPKDDIPVEKDISSEKPAGETPPVQEVSAEPSQAVQDGPPSKETNKDARMWGMICHLAGLCGLIPIVPVIGSIIGPLVVWQIKKDEFGFVDEQGKEAVNFQISILLYLLVSAILWVPLLFVCIGAVIPVAISIVDLIFLLIAAVKANDGEHYRYPLSIRFIK